MLFLVHSPADTVSVLAYGLPHRWCLNRLVSLSLFRVPDYVNRAIALLPECSQCVTKLIGVKARITLLQVVRVDETRWTERAIRLVLLGQS